ncbi:MAG: Rieske 2Fe-2S domain-containing protein [Anaerosomatales bacterium]|nr:Rieske 2Fe-2S domain-containing protein [Anaerosomatales bacterium]
MSDSIDVLGTDDLQDGQMTAVKSGGHDFLVARVGEEYFVSDKRCPHLKGNLSKGTLEGTVVTCPLHHSQFDLRDGSVVRWTDLRGAALSIASAVRGPRTLRVYDAEVVDERVVVRLPE